MLIYLGLLFESANDIYIGLQTDPLAVVPLTMHIHVMHI